MNTHTYIVRVELPSGGRYSVYKYAPTPQRARDLLTPTLPEGAKIVGVSKMRP